MPEDKSDRKAFAEGFAGVTQEELEALSDVELAQFQNGWNPEATRDILASKEWERRLAMRQLQEQFRLEEKLATVNRWWGIGSSLIGVVGTLAGVLLGLWLAPPAASTTASGPAVAPSPAKAPSTLQAASTPTLSASSAIQGLRASQAAPNQ